jgi:indolepyruvate ferredoxin oxidoreductase beta subunit
VQRHRWHGDIQVTEPADATPRPLTILLCALGGEGGGVLSEWLVEAAQHDGYPVQSTSIPGVAQRTGATTYYVEIFPVAAAHLGGRRPVFSLYPVPGALDVLVSSELLETVRQIGNGLPSPGRTQIITSSTRVLTTTERMQMADGRMADGPLLEAVRRYSREHHVVDMAELTRAAGTVVSAVMFGALAAGGMLPFSRATCEAVIRAGGKGADASLRGFAKAYDTVREGRERSAFVQRLVATGEAPASNGVDTPVSLLRDLPAEVRTAFPVETHDIVGLGYARMLDYQDARYAASYLQRLARVVEAERAADPAGGHGWAATRETARYLALWMAFDDIVRVADLKCRASRRARVRREVKVGDGELLRVYDHFKPGVAEFAALLPGRVAARLTRWDRARQAAGRDTFAVPLKIGMHSVLGFGALRLLAGLRWLRRRGSRFHAEQALIERWLAAVTDGTRSDWALGYEIAACGRLIKGYGSTNERGKENLLHVVDHLARPQAPGGAVDRVAAIRAARAAALADDAGKAFDETLAAHGAPVRPVKAVPIRFVRRSRTA